MAVVESGAVGVFASWQTWAFFAALAGLWYAYVKLADRDDRRAAELARWRAAEISAGRDPDHRPEGTGCLGYLLSALVGVFALSAGVYYAFRGLEWLWRVHPILSIAAGITTTLVIGGGLAILAILDDV